MSKLVELSEISVVFRGDRTTHLRVGRYEEIVKMEGCPKCKKESVGSDGEAVYVSYRHMAGLDKCPITGEDLVAWRAQVKEKKKKDSYMRENKSLWRFNIGYFGGVSLVVIMIIAILLGLGPEPKLSVSAVLILTATVSASAIAWFKFWWWRYVKHNQDIEQQYAQLKETGKI